MNTTTAGATAPSFAPQVTFVVGVFSNAYSVAVGDFNGDGRPDLVVTDYLNHSVSVLLNTTAVGATVPSFAPQVFFGVGCQPVLRGGGRRQRRRPARPHRHQP